MSIEEYFEIKGEKRKTIPADPTKIHRKPLIPDKVEADLSRSERGNAIVCFSLSFKVIDNDISRSVEAQISLGKVTDEEARRQYHEITRKLDEGNYKITYTDDGKMEVEI